MIYRDLLYYCSECTLISHRQTFDKVAVLYEGRQIYYGPVHLAKDYFVNLGYHCPDRQTTPDFLTSLTNPAERVARTGFEAKVPRSPDDFAKAWEESALHKEPVSYTHLTLPTICSV